MSAIVRLANEKGVAIVGADKGYITSVAGLGEFDCGKKSGWMGTIDDWFANTGFSSVTVSSGVLEPGSEVDLMYTLDGGPTSAATGEATIRRWPRSRLARASCPRRLVPVFTLTLSRCPKARRALRSPRRQRTRTSR